MQSSGTSTPAGDSPGPGRVFLRKTDFTPEIAPPRLRRTTYPAGQSPLVLPGLTRASSSFTITSNHQNILPLWPAAPPPGQPVVFFVRCPALVRSVFLLSGGMVCQEGNRPALYHGGPLCRTRDREDEFSLSASLSSLARQPSGCPVTEPRPAGKNALLCAVPCRYVRCPAGVGRADVAAPLLSYAPGLGRDPAPPCRSSRKGVMPSADVRCPSPSHLFFLLRRCRALSACCAAGERQDPHGPHRPGNPAAQKKTPTGMETGGRQESLYGCGVRDQNSL